MCGGDQGVADEIMSADNVATYLTTHGTCAVGVLRSSVRLVSAFALAVGACGWKVGPVHAESDSGFEM